jgi:CYTH domain-containing protein
MNSTRSFLLAPSLARLLEKERGGHRVSEGYFPDRHDRNIYVRVEEEAASLVLVTREHGEPAAMTADLPRVHAAVLLSLAAGSVEYQRIDLPVDAYSAHISRIIAPGLLDLIVVEFAREEQARAFEPPAWFGPEVTADPSYQNRSLAIAGLPGVPEVELTDRALDSLLDGLEDGSTSSRLPIEPLALTAPSPATDAAEDTEDLGIEDSVIRELARSLRPKHR